MSEVILLYDQNHSDGIRNFNEIGNEAWISEMDAEMKLCLMYNG